MDTEHQQWLCDICNRKYSSKRKDVYLLSKCQPKNKDCIEHEEELDRIYDTSRCIIDGKYRRYGLGGVRKNS